jgi:hypothetical protein
VALLGAEAGAAAVLAASRRADMQASSRRHLGSGGPPEFGWGREPSRLSEGWARELVAQRGTRDSFLFAAPRYRTVNLSKRRRRRSGPVQVWPASRAFGDVAVGRGRAFGMSTNREYWLEDS